MILNNGYKSISVFLVAGLRFWFQWVFSIGFSFFGCGGWDKKLSLQIECLEERNHKARMRACVAWKPVREVNRGKVANLALLQSS